MRPWRDVIMQGRLTEHPLVEILRELTAEAWSGALRLAHERIKAVCYFERGTLIYVASNLKQYRLADSLRRAGQVSDAQLAHSQSAQVPDLKLAQTLLENKLVARAEIEKVFSWQAREILQMALQWPDGEWQLEARVHPVVKFELNVPLAPLLLEAARKISLTLIKKRFAPVAEQIALSGADWQHAALTPHEGFLITRIVGQLSLGDLLASSGLPADEAYKSLYVLATAGFVTRTGWFSALAPTVFVAAPEAETPPEVPSVNEEAQARRDLESFFARVEVAQDHYQMLQVERDATPQAIKEAYYKLARKFHPDLFRHAEPAVRNRVETGFALAARAYDVLKDPEQRTRYTAKLPDETELMVDNSNRRLSVSPPVAPAGRPLPPNPPRPAPAVQSVTPPTRVESKPATPVATRPASRPGAPSPILPPPVQLPAAPVAPPPLSVMEAISPAQQKRADDQFQRGLAALASGDIIAAIVCLAEAVRLVPGQASYHAYFGRALSSDPHSRRQAEAEVTTALQLEPHNIEYRFILAEVYWNIGFPLRAQGELARVLDKDPFHRDARTLRDKMNTDNSKK